jgi:hypothetical protein
MAMLDSFSPSRTLSGNEVAEEIHGSYLKEWNLELVASLRKETRELP